MAFPDKRQQVHKEGFFDQKLIICSSVCLEQNSCQEIQKYSEPAKTTTFLWITWWIPLLVSGKYADASSSLASECHGQPRLLGMIAMDQVRYNQSRKRRKQISQRLRLDESRSEYASNWIHWIHKCFRECSKLPSSELDEFLEQSVIYLASLARLDETDSEESLAPILVGELVHFGRTGNTFFSRKFKNPTTGLPTFYFCPRTFKDPITGLFTFYFFLRRLKNPNIGPLTFCFMYNCYSF